MHPASCINKHRIIDRYVGTEDHHSTWVFLFMVSFSNGSSGAAGNNSFPVVTG